MASALRRHCRPLSAAAATLLADLIDARSFDLYDEPMGSLAELEAYAEQTSSALMRLAAQILRDGNDPRLIDADRGMPASPMRSRGCWSRFRCMPRGGSSMCRST